MKHPIAISVIVPAYNEEKLISQCLKSLIDQNFYKPYEIIVVDNNSQDRTYQVASKFEVKIIKETHQGVVWARQKGLSQAYGEIIVQADSDSIYPPNWLNLIYRHFSDPLVVAVGGPAIAQEKPFWAFWVYKYSFRLVNFIYQKTGKVIYLGGFNLGFRRKIFQQLGGYHTYLDFGGDELDVLYRLRKLGKIVFEPQAYMYISTRRYRVGFIRFWLVHTFYYYVLNFFLANLFKKTIIKAKSVRNI